ncbi:hypothetical protein EUTSA_v10010125mg [Eutrema salsugineum]|uniref:Uncharacterized protein n=1 Tax=Eutrema salsugineum TaxID=72664 RepID=V4LYM7_EUTSA|nr:midasin isoform X2 [Eutrema salsugineum]ESQ44993.1 hypothetical protein EUTSA_v10010125mg [Eutrema salsugineum]
MEERREESESVGDCREPTEGAGKGLGLSSQTETLAFEDATTVEVGNGNTGNSVSDDASPDDLVETKDNIEETLSSGDVEKTDAITEPETEGNQVERDDDAGAVEVKPVNGESHEIAGEEGNVISGGNEVTGEKENCEVEENGGAYDAEQNVQTEKSQQSPVDGEMLPVSEEKTDQEEEEAARKSEEEDINKMDVDSKQANEENVAAQVSEVSPQLSKEDTNEENLGNVSEVSEICREEDENGEAMEVDYATEEPVEKNVTVGGVLDNAGSESAGASMVQTQDVPIAEADKNDSNVVKEMETDERKDSANMASDVTETIESAELAKPNSPNEDAAPGNIQDLKSETGNVSLKEDKKASDLAEGVATVETLKSVDAKVDAESRDQQSLSAQGIENESKEARLATESPREASDAIMGSDENQEDMDHECLDQKAVDHQDTMGNDNDTTHEAPTIDPDQKEDTEMEENPNSFDYADDGTNSDTKTNGVKRKADVLSEDSPGEGRKTVSFAKVSFAERPSFKIGACIARAASQMAGTPSVLKGGNLGDETLAVESFVSQLHCAATDPDKENVVSEIAAGFFLDFRNSTASQQITPEMVSKKRGRPSNSTVGGTEAFDFEEMGDTYWTDRVIHNGGEEQTSPTEKGNYQITPVELKPAQVKRTRRPYRRRQSQISVPLPSDSDKPANFDENAPAELIMNFSETDTIPPEKSLSKMFRHFGPIRESQTEVDKENNRARVVYRKGADAEVAYNSAGRFNIFGTKAVNYELSFTITETFKVQPYVVSLGEEEPALSLPS